VYGIPENVLQTIRDGTYGEVVTGYGNGFGLLCCLDGIKKDLALGEQNRNVEPYLASANIYQKRGDDYQFDPDKGTRIWLWKKS